MLGKGTINQDRLLLIGRELEGRAKSDEKIEKATHRLAFPELLLGTVKVKVHVQTLHKLGDWIFVGVRLLKKQKRYFFRDVSMHPKSFKSLLNRVGYR